MKYGGCENILLSFKIYLTFRGIFRRKINWDVWSIFGEVFSLNFLIISSVIVYGIDCNNNNSCSHNFCANIWIIYLKKKLIAWTGQFSLNFFSCARSLWRKDRYFVSDDVGTYTGSPVKIRRLEKPDYSRMFGQIRIVSKKQDCMIFLYHWRGMSFNLVVSTEKEQRDLTLKKKLLTYLTREKNLQFALSEKYRAIVSSAMPQIVILFFRVICFLSASNIMWPSI